MNLKKKILNNPLIKLLYKTKFYLNVSISEISWFTGKLPELMAVLYLFEKFGYDISGQQIIFFGIVITTTLIITGYAWKNMGFWEVEKYVNAAKDPVTNELYTAAKKINEGK